MKFATLQWHLSYMRHNERDIERGNVTILFISWYQQQYNNSLMFPSICSAVYHRKWYNLHNFECLEHMPAIYLKFMKMLMPWWPNKYDLTFIVIMIIGEWNLCFCLLWMWILTSCQFGLSIWCIKYWSKLRKVFIKWRKFNHTRNYVIIFISALPSSHRKLCWPCFWKLLVFDSSTFGYRKSPKWPIISVLTSIMPCSHSNDRAYLVDCNIFPHQLTDHSCQKVWYYKYSQLQRPVIWWLITTWYWNNHTIMMLYDMNCD